MKRCATFLALLLLTSPETAVDSAARAEEAGVGPVVFSLKKMDSSMIDSFRAVDGLEFDVGKKIDIIDPVSKGVKDTYTEDLKYSGKGSLYKYTYSNHTHGLGFDDVTTNAFDGTHYYAFGTSGGELTISSSRPRDLDLSLMQGLFEPFAFLLSKDNDETIGGAFMFPTLQDYKTDSTWKMLFKKLEESVDFKKDLEDTVTVVLPGGIMPWTNTKTTFKVFFTKENGYFPVAWERSAVDGTFRYSYRVTHFKSISFPNSDLNFRYPEVAVLEKYVGGNTTPIYRATIQVNNVSINQPHDEDWSVDPAQANFIIDTTRTPAVVINVPK